MQQNFKKLDFNDQQNGVQIFDINKFGDDRGDFVNIPFDISYKRSYVISNNQANVVRAFHGHKNEAKCFYVIKGSFKFILIHMETGEWKEYSLLASVPKTLFVPAGYYNGFVSLSDDSILMTYSSSSMDESRNDDFRLPFNVLGEEVWKINNR